jgi:mono/diheme cytochrome c family protein
MIIWSRKMKKGIIPIALLTVCGIAFPAGAQSADPRIGRDLVERNCSACHQIESGGPPKNPLAPSMTEISRMPSTTELSIKVFLRTSHKNMPNIILSPEEIDSVAAYIVGLKGTK